MDNLTHPEDKDARHRQFRHIIERGFPDADDLGERPVIIGDDALIGCQCVILRGVTIGEGAIIGAGSVVTGDVPAMTVYAGNPARFVRAVMPASPGA
jgi:acetyltransferase-like isoleucine patch superfamily enzyme